MDKVIGSKGTLRNHPWPSVMAALAGVATGIEACSLGVQDPTYARIFFVLNKALNPTITGLALRLAFHDAGTWDAKTKPVGGCLPTASLKLAVLCHRRDHCYPSTPAGTSMHRAVHLSHWNS